MYSKLKFIFVLNRNMHYYIETVSAFQMPGFTLVCYIFNLPYCKHILTRTFQVYLQ